MIVIDPYQLDAFPRDREGFEQLVLYSIAAAGHSAWVMARNIELFIAITEKQYPAMTAFAKVRALAHKGGQTNVAQTLTQCGFGTPNQFARGWIDAATNLDLPTDVAVSKLEKIHRIGPKTARMIVHNAYPEWPKRAKEDQRELAILDRLILRWIRSKGYWNCPKDTPQSPKLYAKWEQVWQKLHAKHKACDLELWNSLTREPPPDWKTRPIKRNGKWYLLNGKEVKKEYLWLA